MFFKKSNQPQPALWLLIYHIFSLCNVLELNGGDTVFGTRNSSILRGLERSTCHMRSRLVLGKTGFDEGLNKEQVRGNGHTLSDPVSPQNRFCFFSILPSLYESSFASLKLFVHAEEVLNLPKPVFLKILNVSDIIESRVGDGNS